MIEESLKALVIPKSQWNFTQSQTFNLKQKNIKKQLRFENFNNLLKFKNLYFELTISTFLKINFRFKF